MRLLILNIDYADFLSWHYARQPELAQASYTRQLAARAEALFGVNESYAHALKARGYQVEIVYANNYPLQRAWAREHGMSIEERVPTDNQKHWPNKLREHLARTPVRLLKPMLRPMLRAITILPPTLATILAAQIEAYRPDLIYNLSIVTIGPRLLSPLLHPNQLLIGQHAATQLPDYEDFRRYNLIVSSFPPTIEALRRRGLRSAYLRLGFDPATLATRAPALRYPVTFIGNFFGVHRSRIELIEAVCRAVPETRIWTPDLSKIPADSPIRHCVVGAAWGREMFEILSASRITLNHHGDIAPYANNMRLYEATGMGTLLITDARQNLSELFTPGRELIAYRDAKECIEQIRYYLAHDDERAAIAQAGQTRTLTEHTYDQRMGELIKILASLA